jgi:hypothetical protein
MSEPTWELLGGGGAVGGPIDYIGNWAAGVQYQPGQIVRYNGVDYLAVNPSIGQTPPAAQGVPSAALSLIFDVVVGRGQAGDPAAPAAVIDSQTILGGNIPQTYKHLWLKIKARGDAAANFSEPYLRLNNDATASYDWQTSVAAAAALSAGEVVGDTKGILGELAGSTSPANVLGQTEVHIDGYTDASFHKAYTFASQNRRSNASGGIVVKSGGGDWRNVAAITRIALFLGAGSYLAGSQFTLYGMA